MSEKPRATVKPEIVALHDDNHHDGDEVKRFAFKDEMGRIAQVLEIGSVYFVTYDPPLEAASGKKIVEATGNLDEVQGNFGLRWARIKYADGTTADADLVIGLIVGMKLKRLHA